MDKKGIEYTLLIFGITLFLTVIALPKKGNCYLKAKGQYIVDSSGQRVLLRGIGLGGWLVPEGYQLKIPGFGSPSSIRSMITDLIGPEQTKGFYERYESHYTTEDDIRQIAAWGFNSIRLPFSYQLLTPKDQPGVYLQEGFQLIDRVLEWCEKNQLYLILDLHCAPGGQNKDNISDADGIEARLWTEPNNQTRTIELWGKIAERYADKEWIGGYDLLNEPVLPPGYTNTHLRSLYMKIAQEIRKVDPNHILFIEGNWYATDFNHLTPPFDTNLVYSFHKYWNENSYREIQNYITIRNTYKVPLWLGESGENSNTWFYDAVRLLEENDIGWNWWTHKKIETLTSPYSSPLSSNYQVVLDYWNGLTNRPSTEFCKNALFEMAENLKTEHCEYRPGVLKALLGNQFGEQSTPLTDHIIPGEINCADYDFGRQGIAYFDIDYQNTRGLGSGDQWNRGYRYRNDGVDIELSQDSQGAKYSIGWIEKGEWINYTVMVEESGEYTIQFRVASPNAEGRFELVANEQSLTPIIAVPHTGGWYNWSTLTIKNIELTEGTVVLKLYVHQAGFNINSMRFSKVSSADIPFNPEIPAKLTLTQNYPNPFNGETHIRYGLPDNAFVRIDIYNSTGQYLTTVETGPRQSGWHQAQWNVDAVAGIASKISSGIYYCLVETRSPATTFRLATKMLYIK
ncbi:cellulase family glycosylhydrolase [candidate division KSB1 bacterium]|nr:cellulase family glycosylhydrolase [candidate division KSB1 bacterium]